MNDYWNEPDDYSDFCPRCGANENSKDMPELTDEQMTTNWYDEGFCSLECWKEYEKDGTYDGLDMPRHKRLSIAEKEELRRLNLLVDVLKEMNERQNKKSSPTIDGLFESLPDGDFNYDDCEAGDWHAYLGSQEWDKKAYYQEIGRKDGKRFFRIGEIDSSGNSDIFEEWNEGEDPKWVIETTYNQNTDYFVSWCNYWSDCAVTGKDPLKDYCKPSSLTPSDCIKFMKDNLKYLLMGLKY